MSLGTATVSDSFTRPAPLINYGSAYTSESFGPQSESTLPAAAYPIAGTVAGISEEEHREIDQAILDRSDRARRIEQLADYVDTIHPDRLVQVAETIATGALYTAGPPTPPREPAAIVRTTPVGEPEWIASVDEIAGTPQPDILPIESRPEPMADLTDLLGYVGQAANIYQQFQSPPPAQNLNATEYPGSWQDWLDGPTDLLEPTAAPPVTSIPTGGNVAAPYAGGCISQRDRRIAAASGVSPEAVDRVLHYARQGRRRRRRMLTKSDLGDIAAARAVMSASDFKVWLAKATR